MFIFMFNDMNCFVYCLELIRSTSAHKVNLKTQPSTQLHP